MEEGIVVRLNKDKKFAFIEREGKTDLHLGTRYTPEVEDGYRVSFEEGVSADGRPTARKVKIIAKADGAPFVPGQKTNEPQEIAVDFDFPVPTRLVEFEEPDEESGETRTVKKLQLPVWVVVTRGNKPALNVEVALTVNGLIVKQPEVQTWTGKDGKAFFRVLLDEQALDCNFSASLEGKYYTRFWQKNPPQAVTVTGSGKASEDNTTNDAEKKLAEIEVVNPPRDPDPTTGLFIVNVVTRKDGQKTNRDFMPFCDQTITIRQSVSGGFAAVTTFTPEATGQYKLFVNFPGDMAKIVFRLDNGKEAAVRLRK